MWTLATIILLALHLLAMNVAGAGPLLCVWMQAWRSRGNELAGIVGRRLAWASLVAMIVGMALGLLQLGVLHLGGDEAYWQALARFPASAYRDAVLELVFTTGCLAVYLASWNWGARRPWMHGAIAVLGSTNLLYHFPPLMVAMRELAARPALVADETVTRPLVRGVLVRPEVVAMSVHFTLASVAVAAVVLMLLTGRAKTVRDTAATAEEHVVRRAALVALVATLVQFAVGVWLLVVLPTTVRSALMGGDLWASVMFLASLVGAMGLMHLFATIALGDWSPQQVRRVAALSCTVVLLMTAAMVLAR